MAAPMDNLFSREFERKNGDILDIKQCSVGDVGCVVWDAAMVLAYFMETDNFLEKQVDMTLKSVKGKRIIELGAGTGLVGLQAACMGGDVTITDLEEFVPLISLNIKTNLAALTGKADARTLIWGEDVKSFMPQPDIILLADCIYYEESLEPLVRTLKDLSSDKTVVYCCFEERLTGNKPYLQKTFFELIRTHFVVEEIPMEMHDELFRSTDIHIVKFTRR